MMNLINGIVFSVDNKKTVVWYQDTHLTISNPVDVNVLDNINHETSYVINS